MKNNIVDKQPDCYTLSEIKPQYWHEWGDEPRGTVSTFAYDKWGDYHFTGYMDISIKSHLPFLNPYS